MIDMARSADLVTWIQTDLTVRMAEETVAALGFRARLISDRTGARLTGARCFGEILTPRQTLAATKDISVRAARAKWVIRETPSIWWARFAWIRIWLADTAVGTDFAKWAVEPIAAIGAYPKAADLVPRAIATAAALFTVPVTAAMKVTAILLAAVFSSVAFAPAADHSL